MPATPDFDNTGGFVTGYDKDIVDKILAIQQDNWIPLSEPPESGETIIMIDSYGFIFDGWCN